MSDDNLFEEMLTAMEREGQATEELYTELKEHYDTIKLNSRRMQGSLTFLSKQAENLIALRQANQQIIKAMVDMKHKQFGNTMKTKMLSVKQETADEDGIPFKVVKYLIDALKVDSNNIMSIEGELVNNPITDDDRLLEGRLSELSDEETTEDSIIPAEIDESTIELVCDELGSYHIVANGYIICDDDYDLPKDSPTYDVGKHGELRAFNSDGKEIKIVRSDSLVFREPEEDGEIDEEDDD